MKEEQNISTIDLLISSYLSGNATPEQTEQFMQWLESSPDNRTYFAASKMVWLTAATPDTAKEYRWEQLQSRLTERESDQLNTEERLLDTRKFYLSILRIAALVLILLGISTVLYVGLRHNDQPSPALSIFEVPYGARSVLTLPDGTRLWINSGSKLSYNSDYGKKNRDIRLSGEAYFEVARNPKLPFVVSAGNLKIKALGTAFNVKAYPDEAKVEATLVHGSIEIKKEGNGYPVILKPNEKFTSVVNTEKETARSGEADNSSYRVNNSVTGSNVPDVKIDKSIDTESETSWKDGRLIFDREPLKSLAVKLERRYDVHFVFTDNKLKEYKYTGTFKDLSLEQILEAMHLSSPVDYVIREKEVLVKENRKY